jgi:hypothetical protein
MRIFYQQASEFLSRKMPDLKEEPYGVMFLLDEFPTLGKMEQIKAGIAYFRGYRVRLFLIIQDTQQLKGTYEEAGMNSFLSNSTFRITFAANNYETANLISQLCGNKTVEQVSSSRPKFFDLNPATRTQNVSSAQRALLLPQEVIQLPRDEQIVLIESMPPIRSKKIFYFKDKFFTERLLPPVFIPTQEPYDPKKKQEEEGDGESVADASIAEDEIESFESDGATDNYDVSEEVDEVSDNIDIPQDDEILNAAAENLENVESSDVQDANINTSEVEESEDNESDTLESTGDTTDDIISEEEIIDESESSDADPTDETDENTSEDKEEGGDGGGLVPPPSSPAPPPAPTPTPSSPAPVVVDPLAPAVPYGYEDIPAAPPTDKKPKA